MMSFIVSLIKMAINKIMMMIANLICLRIMEILERDREWLKVVMKMGMGAKMSTSRRKNPQVHLKRNTVQWFNLRMRNL